MVITRNGIINRQNIDEIRVIGRATQGVRLVNLDENDSVMDVARVIPEDPADASSNGAPDGDGGEGERAGGEKADGAKGDGDGADSAVADGGEGSEASVDSGAGDAVGLDPDAEGE